MTSKQAPPQEAPQAVLLSELSARLQLEPKVLNALAQGLSFIKERHLGDERAFDAWEVERLTQARDFYVGSQRNVERTIEALERWVSRHPRPQPPSLAPDDDLLELSQDEASPALPELPASVLTALTSQAQASVPPQQPSLPAVPASPSLQVNVSSAPPSARPGREVSVDEVNRWKSHFQNAQRELRQTQHELERARDKITQQHAAIKQLQGDFSALKELIRKEIYDLRDLVVDSEED